MRSVAWAMVAAAFCLHRRAFVLAQDTESVNAEGVFVDGDVILRTSNFLQPASFNPIPIVVPSNYSNPDVLLVLNSTTGSTGLFIYCNPTDPSPGSSGAYAGPGNAEWYSDLSTTVNEIFISRNDDQYKAATSNITGTVSFMCTVFNSDANYSSNYTLVARALPSNRSLVSAEQSVLSNFFSRCCTSTAGSCAVWKTQNKNFVDANGGAIDTDFCSFPGQICNPSGNLYRLDFSNYNLSCSWPGDLLSQFSHLSTLNLVGNTLLTGNTSVVLATLTNLTQLQFLMLDGCTGISGNLDNGTANQNLCKAAQGNLVVLGMNGIGLKGTLPSCLYAKNSNLTSLDLGSNNLTGSIADVFPVGSKLQLLRMDNNLLSGSLPASLANATYLVDLEASNNSFSGTIPPALGALPSLEQFVISYNNFSGVIPDTFGTNNNLEIFDAKQNSLTRLPAAWTNASHNAQNSSYAVIRVSFNQIQGPFPTGLVSAEGLTFLVLNVNNMSGTLPSNASQFLDLRALNISYNQFSGTIPSALASAGIFSQTPLMSDGGVFPTVFDASYNKLNGSVPDFLAASRLPFWAKPGIHLMGNQLQVNCSNSSFAYITDLCGNQTAAPAPAPAKTAAAAAATPPPPGTPPPPFASSGAFGGSAPSSSAKSNSTTVVLPSSSETSSKSGSGGLSGGAIAGIVVGALVGLAVAAVAAVLLLRRKRPSSASRDPPRARSSVFTMPTLSPSGRSGEMAKQSSLTKKLSGLSHKSSGFERFQDEEQIGVELPTKH